MNQQREKMVLAPIALFTFNRPEHTRKTLESLALNPEFAASPLFIFCDGERNGAESAQVEESRKLVRDWPHPNKTIIERDWNWGLAKSIIDGVSKVANEFGRVIVLEDDLVTSPYFLTYMNEALEKYADDDRVISIHGYVYPVKEPLPEAFFLPGADCWGWATWQRGWACFNADGRFLLDELKRRKLIRAFDYNGAYPFSKTLQGQIKGKNDSWAVRWYASALLAGKLTLYPGRSLVHNIGNDNSGTHCGESADFDVELSERPIDLNHVNVAFSQKEWHVFEDYFRQGQAGWLRRLLDKFIA